MSVLTYTDKDSNELEIQPNTEWENWGDANPKIHGGMFIQWDNDHWHIIETIHGSVLPDGYISDDMVEIRDYWAYPDELFESGDPNNGPTDYFKSEIEQLSRVSGYENALVDFDIEYFLSGITSYYHTDRTEHIDESDYWDKLTEYGIPVEKFQ